jgi:hypothetical protein
MFFHCSAGERKNTYYVYTPCPVNFHLVHGCFFAIIFSKKTIKESPLSRQAGGDVKFFAENTTRGTRVEIFSKTRRATNFTSLHADLSLLYFFVFLVRHSFFIPAAMDFFHCSAGERK